PAFLPLRSARRGRGERRLHGRRLLARRAHLEELLDHDFLQVVDHLLEHVERFLLVLGERIALAVPAEADALFQVIHVQEVLAPELIDAAEAAAVPLESEDDPALEAVELLVPDLGLALAVHALRLAGDHLDQRSVRDDLAVLHVRGQTKVELPGEPLVEPGPVPVLRMRAGRRIALDSDAGHLADPLEDGLLLILVLETLAADAVDDLALLVHHVVILEQVLADLEVPRLHALLGGADGARHQLVLDGLALLHAEAIHDALDALGAEDAQEVVLERE